MKHTPILKATGLIIGSMRLSTRFFMYSKLRYLSLKSKHMEDHFLNISKMVSKSLMSLSYLY